MPEPRYFMSVHRPRRRRAPWILWLLLLAGWASALALGFGYLEPWSREGGPLPVPHDEGTARLPEDTPDSRPEPGLPAPVPSLPEAQLSPTPGSLLQPGYDLAQAGDEGWDFHRQLSADLTGDGKVQTIHLIARVERTREDPYRFAWDDGHLWQVYVEDNGHRTHLFSRWVQMGEVKVAVLDDDQPGEGRSLLILTWEGAGVTAYRLRYHGPDQVDFVQLLQVPILAQMSPETR